MEDRTTIKILQEVIKREHGDTYPLELIAEIYVSAGKAMDLARIALSCPDCIGKLKEKYGSKT